MLRKPPPPGTPQQVMLNSDYVVPSQEINTALKTAENADQESESELMSGSKCEPYLNFLHSSKSFTACLEDGEDTFLPLYQTCTKLAKKLGEEGNMIMKGQFEKNVIQST